jgi:hypothetical protein
MFNILHKKIGGLDCNRAEAAARLIKLYVAQAADQRATKIVFGEPCEAQCRRVPLKRDSTPGYPPWEGEDRARLSGRSEQGLAEEQEARAEEWCKNLAEGRAIPVWFRVGDTYEESSGLPAFLIFDIMSVMKSWDRGTIPWEGEKPDWNKVADLTSPVPAEKLVSSLLLNLPSQIPSKGGLSNFLLRLEDGRIIEASFGFEPSFCLSISVHDTGRKI